MLGIEQEIGLKVQQRIEGAQRQLFCTRSCAYCATRSRRPVGPPTRTWPGTWRAPPRRGFFAGGAQARDA